MDGLRCSGDSAPLSNRPVDSGLPLGDTNAYEAYKMGELGQLWPAAVGEPGVWHTLTTSCCCTRLTGLCSSLGLSAKRGCIHGGKRNRLRFDECVTQPPSYPHMATACRTSSLGLQLTICDSPVLT